MSAHDLEELDEFRQGAGLSHGELWLRYFELGGMSTGFELEAFLYGVLRTTPHDHDVIESGPPGSHGKINANCCKDTPEERR